MHKNSFGIQDSDPRRKSSLRLKRRAFVLLAIDCWLHTRAYLGATDVDIVGWFVVDLLVENGKEERDHRQWRDKLPTHHPADPRPSSRHHLNIFSESDNERNP